MSIKENTFIIKDNSGILTMFHNTTGDNYSNPIMLHVDCSNSNDYKQNPISFQCGSHFTVISCVENNSSTESQDLASSFISFCGGSSHIYNGTPSHLYFYFSISLGMNNFQAQYSFSLLIAKGPGTFGSKWYIGGYNVNSSLKKIVPDSSNSKILSLPFSLDGGVLTLDLGTVQSK